jgi:hypothetical protein
VKYLLLFIATLFLHTITAAQTGYWQQQVNYKINVQLNDEEHTLDGFAKIDYINHSPDTLRYIWFHVWPNAYRTDKTAFSDQLLENERIDFYFSNQEDRGYINRLSFRVNEELADVEDHPQHIDIIKLLLPKPLPPGDRIEITTPFHVQLPKNFSRGGHTGTSYQIAQWYPKPAVYDRSGWHPMPYLDQGEFYSEFGDYEVIITVPKSYVVMSSGILQTAEELLWLQERNKNYKPAPTVKKPFLPPPKTTVKPIPVKKIKEETKTLILKQKTIHDFAWFADNTYLVETDTLQLPSGKIIQLFSAYFPKEGTPWKKSIQMMKDAVLFRSKAIGEYPYETIAAVEAKMGFPGGMEYPCITAITPTASEQELELVIEHEIGHNWFQGMLGSNERRYPWMDEGINSFYEKRFRAEVSRYRKSSKETNASKRELDDNLLLESMERWKKDQPLDSPSDSLTETNYFLISYTKGAAFMKLLETELGRSVFDNGMQSYFNKWQYKHPEPADLQKELESVSGKNLNTIFSLLQKKGPLLPKQKKNVRLYAGLGFNSATTNAVLMSPLGGVNQYDGLMAGAVLHNYTLPATPFQFLVAPLYGTKSKELNGIARISYNWYTSKKIERIQFSLTGMKFNTGDFTDSADTKYITGFRKIVPSVKLILAETNPRSTRLRFAQWKTFLIDEDRLQFKRDTFPNGNAFTTISKRTSGRYLNQLRLVTEDTRALYPYRAELVAEQAKDFMRLAFTGNYYFNYNEKLGANVRFFAGKFFYLGGRTITKQFQTDPYHLNMTGPKGYEDYTYSNYFAGRSEFDGFASQQIMMRDGGFKVRTDLLANKIGKTDDWLMAFNFVSDIPDQINILNILPVKIPLKIYLDIGTYADAWRLNSEETRILYNAGLQLSILKNTIQVYVPLLYSNVYRNYFDSTIPDKQFVRNISFSIDLQNISLKKLDRQFPN